MQASAADSNEACRQSFEIYESSATQNQRPHGHAAIPRQLLGLSGGKFFGCGPELNSLVMTADHQLGTRNVAKDGDKRHTVGEDHDTRAPTHMSQLRVDRHAVL